MSYADKTIACRDCGMEFVFTSGEQEFYVQKGFANEPTRCPSCRQQRKAGGGGRSGGYGSRGGEYSHGEREMHSAICASCGKEAQVPFVPRGDKPVYCADCFRQQRHPLAAPATAGKARDRTYRGNIPYTATPLLVRATCSTTSLSA